jgi:hypothetical protein
MSESSKTPLMVIFCEPNNATDNRVLDLLFNNAIQVAETGAEICWFRESKPLVIPKWNQKPKPHHLRRIFMYYGNDNVDQLLIEFGQHKLYSLSPNLASVIVRFYDYSVIRFPNLDAGRLFLFLSIGCSSTGFSLPQGEV